MSNEPQQSSLFSEQELHNMEGNLFADREESKPVTCLGMEFESDEARREFFRAELRKLLPELRHIEGFPIGEDDDIIALSDPPYYTACPNPWLNDFIAQWEAEKADLEARGLRTSDFEVKEPYAADVSEGKQNPIYNAHTYHTKVPHPAIMRYILHYTQPGDIVFDGFCGTGMTSVAANLCDSITDVKSLIPNTKLSGIRHSICSDLSPMATFIASNYSCPIDENFFLKKATNILSHVRSECDWMYRTRHEGSIYGEIVYVVWSDVFVCPNCGNDFSFYDAATNKKDGSVNKDIVCPICGSKHSKKSLEHAIETSFDVDVNETRSLSKTVPVLIKYRVGKKSYIKKPDEDDIELINKINSLKIPYWIPTQELLDGYNTNQPIRTNGLKDIHQFYTKRNLYILSSIYSRCEDDNHLKLLFTSQLMNLSKLNRYRPEVSFPYNPLNGTLYIASQVCESNVFDAYKNKIDKLYKAFSLLQNVLGVVCVQSATNLLIKDNSFDYIFVDPPFGANIMYSDLNSIWEGWLKVKTESTDEAIVNPYQNKTLFDYQNLMNASLKEFYRVLKPGKWLTMEFSNTSASVWNSIQNALQGVGFVIANVAALDKQQGSFKAVTTTTAVKQDLIITCYKPTAELTQKFQNSSDTAANVWDFVSELLEHLSVHMIKEQKTTTIVERSPKILFDRVIAYYVQHGYPVPMNAQEFQKGLRDRFIELDGMFFTAHQAAEYKDKKREAPEMLPMGLIVSDEANGIEWLKLELKTPQTYQEIQPKWLQAVGAVRKHDIIPELSQILEENFIEEPDGKWRLPNIQDDKDVVALRTKALMREFKLYVEQASKPKGKIKEARVEALRAGFKQCYIDKDFKTILLVGDRIPSNLRDEDEELLRFYNIALNKI